MRQSDREDPTDANNILLGGLAYQVFSMGIFVILSATFVFRARAAIREAQLSLFSLVFCVAAVLVYLRTCFRLAETAQGLSGELQTNEVYFACLEFVPVAIAVVLYAVWFPGRCVGSRVSMRPGEEQPKDRPAPSFY